MEPRPGEPQGNARELHLGRKVRGRGPLRSQLQRHGIVRLRVTCNKAVSHREPNAASESHDGTETRTEEGLP